VSAVAAARSAVAYAEFLARKTWDAPMIGIDPVAVHPSLFDFQAACVRWAVRRGRAALFADTGLGKTRMQIEWLRQVSPSGAGLIVAPLGVAEQTIAEAAQVGVAIRRAKRGDDCAGNGYWITNYERIDSFVPSGFDAVVLDESSILKSMDGKTRTRLVKDWTVVPFRLCCTATPAPNDIAELGNHAAFLGIMTPAEMLATFFVHYEKIWRLKGHGRSRFYEWLASWALYLRRPSDLGFSDEGFELPPLTIREHVVPTLAVPDGGWLFPTMGSGIAGRTIARRGSLDARVEALVAEVVASPGPWVVWCGLDSEQNALVAALGDDAVSVRGSDPPAEKVAREIAWRTGSAGRVLVTKPRIFGFGMNWQHCAQVAFCGLGDSWENYYQAIRRCWRFGQQLPVTVVCFLGDQEGVVAANLRRKERDAKLSAEEVLRAVGDIERAAVRGAARTEAAYELDAEDGEGWVAQLGDSTERLRGWAPGSVGLSLHSPPFASLYTYSASDRDLGNSRDYDQFFEHYKFIVAELLRVTMPGRRAIVHVQQITTTAATHGVIGWRDFRADVVRSYQATGWVYDGEVVIDKDPQAQAIRTKSKALLFVQKSRDAAWLRPAMADYLLCFRAPGVNPHPVLSDVTNEEWIAWARPIWYGIRESDTLSVMSVRAPEDERHIAPLQLGTIERAVRLWSNVGDLVADPFMGIGSTGVVALGRGRRFSGIELKPAYWRQAVANLRAAAGRQGLPLS